MIRFAAVFLALTSALAPMAAVAQTYIEGQHYWFEPAAFHGNALVQHRGPATAKGIVIWNDGFSPDKSAPEKVPPLAQFFAEAGWDVFNLRRHSIVHGGRGVDGVAAIILQGVDRARSLGYQRVVLLGQSRGAFGSIQAATYRPEILGLVALAPGWTADYGKSREWRQNDYDIRAYWEAFGGTRYRVALAVFNNDDLYETKEPHVRGPYARKRLAELGLPHLVIDQPDYAGMAGHGGGTNWEFARRYGPCLEYFLDTGNTPSCEESDATTAGIFGLRLPPQPAPDGFAGLWQGTWKNGRFYALVLQGEASGKYKGVYHTGIGINGEKPESSAWSLTRNGTTLVRDRTKPNDSNFRLTLLDTNRLQVDWTTAAGDRPTTVIFSRAR